MIIDPSAIDTRIPIPIGRQRRMQVKGIPVASFSTGRINIIARITGAQSCEFQSTDNQNNKETAHPAPSPAKNFHHKCAIGGFGSRGIGRAYSMGGG